MNIKIDGSVCNSCKNDKLSQFRSGILSRFTQADVDEPIEEEL
jgi:hypothetical protein